MTRLTTENNAALANLRALLEVNGQIAREHGRMRLEGQPSDEVASTLDSVTRSAAMHRDELARLIGEWERARSRREGRGESRVREPVVTPREVVESWLDIKESAAELYRRAATDAPTHDLRVRLLALAQEEDVHCERLRRLL